MEKSKLLDKLFALRKADMEKRDKLREKLYQIADQLLLLNGSSQAQTKIIEELKNMLADRDNLIDKFQKKMALKEQKRVSRNDNLLTMTIKNYY